MKTEVKSVRDPSWANPECTKINCWVRTNYWINEGPFCASPNDAEEHGRDVFMRCIRGEFGPIKPYYPPGHADYIDYDSKRNFQFILPDQYEKTETFYTRRPEIIEFLNEANIENSRGTIRGIALVWGSMLEHTLDEFIAQELIFIEITKNRKFKIRESSLCNKIDFLHKHGLIGDDARIHLHLLREIRNCCAHEWSLNFSNPKVKSLVDKFKTLQSRFTPDLIFHIDLELLIKIVYSHACMNFIMYFADRTKEKFVGSF